MLLRLVEVRNSLEVWSTAVLTYCSGTPSGVTFGVEDGTRG